MKTPTRFACMLLLVTHPSIACAEEGDAKIEQIVKKIASAQRFSGMDYQYLFATAGKSGLAALRRSQCDSIAIHAAWEEARSTVPEKRNSKVQRLDKGKLNWFVGFLEGRARVDAPRWWAQAVVDAHSNGGFTVSAGEPSKKPYHNAGIEGVDAPHDTTIKTEGSDYMLTIGMDTITIPDEFLRRTDKGQLYGNFSGCFTPKHCFVTEHSDVGAPHDVVCINRSSGEVVWKAEACGSLHGLYSIMSYGYESWVSVTVQEDRVVVFGASPMGLYAHAFRIDNGKTVFRFSSRF